MARKPTRPQALEQRHAAHSRRESEAYALKPWEMSPVSATLPGPPTDGTVHSASWALARERRLALLAKDPRHYDDLEGHFGDAKPRRAPKRIGT